MFDISWVDLGCRIGVQVRVSAGRKSLCRAQEWSLVN